MFKGMLTKNKKAPGKLQKASENIQEVLEG